ncbi:MAG: B12-binding domain-containing radical SAM protein [Phycisphaerae bacterium]|nr:MAG: B12-binding domain-containing radical SAM protein [Phycisphaerae bacterium]
MPHVALVPFTGLRIKEKEMLDLGMSLPSLRNRGADIAHLPALGLLTLAGLTPEHWTQSYHEAEADADGLFDQIVACNPTLVAISALTATINEAYALAKKIRSAGIPVVLGGLHATACPAEVQRHCDAVVVGEGESVWLELLADVEAGTLKSIYQASAPFDLGTSPVPRFDLLPPGTRPRMTLQTQRGCPFACDFCGASRLLGPFREKPTAAIENELRAMMQSGSSRLLELADDNTFAGKRDWTQLFELFARYKIRYFTEVDWRIGEDPKLLRALAASGCIQVLVGVESLVHPHTGMGLKTTSIHRVMDAIASIQAHGIAVTGCFIVGSDGETEQSIDELGAFLLQTDLADIQLTLLTPFPGTALYRRLKKAGRILTDRDWSHYTLFDATYQPDQMSVLELERSFRDLVRHVFEYNAVTKRARIKEGILRKHFEICG